MTFSRYWHTARHLKPVQVYGRLWFRASRPRPDHRAAPPHRAPHAAWISPGWRQPSLLAPSSATFLNETADISGPQAWTASSHPRLWLYNLHYFDDLTAAAAGERRAWHRRLVERWIAEHSPAAAPGWEPYPTSLRLVNWIKTAWADDAEGRAVIDAAARDSLAIQARWLARRLEHHIQANHLWANAKALVFAGVFFSGTEAAAWLRIGTRLAQRELAEQVLADGGHYERSPMYHAIVLEDVLDLLQLDRCFPGVLDAPLVAQLRQAAINMLRWLRRMTHPDGDIAFFNDAAIGGAARYDTLDEFATRLGVEVERAPLQSLEILPDSGYVRAAVGRAVLFCDLAAVGPDHQPGHAHADTLSFELSVDGRRCLVNSGTSTYAAGPLRHFQRSTPAHNTVVVDDEDSSEVWGCFRVARRARLREVSCLARDGVVSIAGAHDGYRRLPGRVLHHRRWVLDDRGLSITDTLSGTYHRAEAIFLLAPGWTLGDGIQISAGPRECGHPEAAEWYPAFGRVVAATRVRVPVDQPASICTVTW